jgi:hypothetical protein
MGLQKKGDNVTSRASSYDVHRLSEEGDEDEEELELDEDEEFVSSLARAPGMSSLDVTLEEIGMGKYQYRLL